MTSPGLRPQKAAIVTGASQASVRESPQHSYVPATPIVATSRSVHPSEDSHVLTVPGDLAEADTAQRVVENDYTPGDFAAMTAVNLGGFFRITQHAISQMAAQGAGHVVNVSTSFVEHARRNSRSSARATDEGWAGSVALAIEYAAQGVRVNAVSLDVTKTPMHDPAEYTAMAAVHPLGRAGEISDVGDGVLYLEPATFVTGETLHIDGGQVAGHYPTTRVATRGFPGATRSGRCDARPVERNVVQITSRRSSEDMEPRETISFEQDIQPLFRERDRNSMSSTFDLWSYNDVANWSDAILLRLRDGSMPCDGAWPEEQVARFEEWVNAGKRA
jgi:Enoyl-(Acyl carrier protein) reductase